MKPNQALLACLEVAVALAHQNPEATPYRIARAVHDLQKVGQQLHRRYEAAANARITLAHQRDPRGWPLIIVVNDREFRIGGVS